MADSYFTRLDETASTGRYLAGPSTVGPWASHLQHGGPPNALAVAAAERVVQAETGRTDLVALRTAAEFVGAVPVAELETRARVVRAARSAVLAEVEVSAEGRACLNARVWFVRALDTADVAAVTDDPPPLPERASALDFEFGYGASLEWRFVRGRLGVTGPGAAWVRVHLPLYEGYDYSGLARVALIADSASGISSELDWTSWSFVNVDLDVHLARPFEDEWLFMDAVTQLGTLGSALARSALSDRDGRLGSSLQTLVLAPIRGN